MNQCISESWIERATTSREPHSTIHGRCLVVRQETRRQKIRDTKVQPKQRAQSDSACPIWGKDIRQRTEGNRGRFSFEGQSVRFAQDDCEEYRIENK